MTDNSEPIKPIIYRWISQKWVAIPLAILVCATIVLTWIVKVKGDIKSLFNRDDSSNESRQVVGVRPKPSLYITENRTDTNGFIWPVESSGFKYQETRVLTFPGYSNDYVIRYKGVADEVLSFHVLDRAMKTNEPKEVVLRKQFEDERLLRENNEFQVQSNDYRYHHSISLTEDTSKLVKGKYLVYAMIRDDSPTGSQRQVFSILMLGSIDTRMLMVRYSYSTDSLVKFDDFVRFAIDSYDAFQK